ncbi:unnamed protein product, partial [Ectocarpus sp. 12 AP-2014]
MNNGQVTDLFSCTLQSVANAVDAFEEEKGLVLCHLRPSAFSKLVPFFSVPQGYYALVQRGGKFSDYGESGSPVWPPGLHFGALKRVTYLITKQSIVYHCNVKRCITRDNIPILVRATLVLRVMGDAEKGEDPSLVRKFVHEVGVRGFEAQLVNAVAEAIRVMARSTAHKAVYALISGPDASRDHPRSPPTSSTANTPACTAKKHSEQNAGVAATLVALERTRQGSIMKRVKVAPDPCSDAESLAEPAMATASTSPAAAATAAESTTAAAVSSSTTAAVERVQGEPSPPMPSPLPAIQRGLRASRIFPLPDAAAATSSDGPTPGQDEEGLGAPFSLVLDDCRRVHPLEALLSAAYGEGSQDPPEGLGSGGGSRGGGGGGHRKVEDGGVKGRIPSRPPPAATNLDLTSSQSAVSSASTLPPLELDVAPLPCLSPTPCSTATKGETTPGGGEDDETDGQDADYNSSDQPGDRTISNPEWGGGAAVDIANEQHRQRGGAEGRRASSTAGATAAQATKEELDSSNSNSDDDDAFLGSRHVDEVRHSLNRTFAPQGVEITTVMIR